MQDWPFNDTTLYLSAEYVKIQTEEGVGEGEIRGAVIEIRAVLTGRISLSALLASHTHTKTHFIQNCSPFSHITHTNSDNSCKRLHRHNSPAPPD